MPDSPKAPDDIARDATRVLLGLGVIGFQRAQVKRRELERTIAGTPAAEAIADTGRALAGIHRGVQRTLDAVEEAAPEPATTFIGLTRSMVEDGGRAISSRVGPWLR